jgi:hypothetical protein
MKDFIRTLTYILFLTSILYGCKPAQKKVSGISKEKKSFVMPEIPATIVEDSGKNIYLAENFWSNFQFTDSLHSVNEAGSYFDSYINLLHQISPENANSAVNNLMNMAGKQSVHMYRMFLDLADKSLYNPNSQICDDELYRPFLENALHYKKLDFATRERLSYRYKINSRNRIGHQATDFKFVTIEGKTNSLYKLHSKYVLIYFNNPGCHECKIMCNQLKTSVQVAKLVNMGVLKILSLYPDDEIAEWKKNSNEIPHDWINAHDKFGKIKQNDIYDLKAIPTIYLLDSKKRVLLKDASFDMLAKYLDNICNRL